MAQDLCPPDTTSPCRETLGLMPDGTEVLMYSIFVVSLAMFFYGFWRKWGMYRRGKGAFSFDRPKERFARLFGHGAAQTKILRKRYAGPMHAMIFYGFLVLFIGTVLVLIDYDITQPVLSYQFLKGWFYLFFEFALDLGGVVFIAGLLMAIKRRVVDKPEALASTWQDAAILTSLLIISASGYVMESLRLAIRQPDWAQYSFVASLFVPLFRNISVEALLLTYRTIWWTHAGLVFLSIAAIPYTKLHHMITSPANMWFAPLYDASDNPKGKLPTPFNLKQMMESGDFDVTVGATKLEDFSKAQLLMADACTECGRCQEVCPAYAAVRPLSPMRLVLDLRDELRAGKRPARASGGQASTGVANQLVEDVVRSETLWSCVTCRACVDACPVDIDHVPLIVEMRRGLVAESRLDKQKSDLLTNLTNTGNAYGLPAAERGKWASAMDVPVVGQHEGPLDVLYWVGCSGSYDPRNQGVSRSVVKILKKAGVRFAILGPNERCTGDPARRLGEEGRFQELALANVETIKASGAKLVLAQCPHCFNTIKNEYREFGLELDVMHHSQYIARLVKEERITLAQPLPEALTYHEPCYLARYNDETESARSVLRVIPQCELREMGRVRKNTFCCGAGGANMWFEVKEEKHRISNLRMTEAMSTGARRVATACPFCLTMLDDASRVMGGDRPPAVEDLAELVAARLAD